MDPSFYEVDHTRPFASLGSITFRRQTSGGRKKRSLFKHGWGFSRFSRNVLRSARSRGADAGPSNDETLAGDPKMHRASDVGGGSDAKPRKKKSKEILDMIVNRKAKSKTFDGSDDLTFEEFPEDLLIGGARDYTPRPSNPAPRPEKHGKTSRWGDWEPYVPLENCSEIDNVSDWSDCFE